MALTDIGFAEAEKSFILEIPTAVYVGKLSDVSYGNRNKNSLIVELLKLITLISHIRKIR